MTLTLVNGPPASKKTTLASMLYALGTVDGVLDCDDLIPIAHPHRKYPQKGHWLDIFSKYEDIMIATINAIKYKFNHIIATFSYVGYEHIRKVVTETKPDSCVLLYYDPDTFKQRYKLDCSGNDNGEYNWKKMKDKGFLELFRYLNNVHFWWMEHQNILTFMMSLGIPTIKINMTKEVDAHDLEYVAKHMKYDDLKRRWHVDQEPGIIDYFLKGDEKNK